MLEITEELNFLAVQGYGLSDAEIEQMTERSRQHLYTVQVEVYNFLAKEGLIKLEG